MSPAEIKELLDRRASALSRRPALARTNGHARVRLAAGLACDVELEARAVRVDLPAPEAGADTGPDPGQLMRASLGASLAMGCRIWGARLGVRIDAVEIELTCDADARGPLGVSADAAVGWSRLRFDIKVTSAEPEEAIASVVETARRLSPMLANLALTVEQVHRLTIARPEHRSSAAERERPVPSQVTPLSSKPSPSKQRKSS
jgi:uncharacterized OsmC-like protein